MRKMTTRMGVELLVPEKGEKILTRVDPRAPRNVMTQVEGGDHPSAAESQHAKDNGGGLVGYFIYLANERPDLFVRLLAKLLPLQRKEWAQTAKEPGR
jgi:hypothetical protein